MKGLNKVVGTLFLNIFDAKVVNHERKTDVQCRVIPKGRSVRYWSINRICEMCSEVVIGNAAGMFDTRHALSDLKVYPTVRASKASKVVLVNDFGWKDVEGEVHIIETCHRSVVVEILDVKGK